MEFTAQWQYAGHAGGAYEACWEFKGSYCSTGKAAFPSSKMQHQNQINFINTQTGCTDTQPAWGDPCSWLTFELWAGKRENAPKPKRVQILPWKSHGGRRRSWLLRLKSGWQLTLGWVAPRLHVALKRVVCTEQLAGFIRSTFSDPEKQPGSLLALLALRCTFFFFYDQ